MRRDLYALYEAPAADQQDVRTVSVDEMTGVQALERAAPTCRSSQAKSLGRSSNKSATARRR
jgi:hypothetical protein